MSHVRLIAVAALLMAPVALPASASELIRIEPRPYYGAVVSIEGGVRVFRGLPTQSLMIINPDNKTPVSLNFTRSIEHKAADTSSNNNGGGSSNDNNGSSGNSRGAASYSGLGTNPVQSSSTGGALTAVRGHKPRTMKPMHN